MPPDRMTSARILRHTWRGCLFAVGLVALGAVVRIWPLRTLGSDLVWLTFYPAVAVAATYGGLSAGLLATVLSCLTVAFASTRIFAQAFAETPADLLGMAVFALSSAMISGFVAVLHRANERAEAARSQAESAAQENAQREQFVKSIINAVPNMVGYWDRDLHFGFANDAYREWYGKQPDAIIGTPIRELMGERLFAMNEPHIRRALAGERQHFQRTLIKPDGSVGYILANYIPDVDAHGKVNGIVIQASDVTELKEAQAELELAASVFENTVEGVAVTNAEGFFLSVNPAFSAITGYTAEEAVGQTPRILKSNRHDHAFYVAMWQDLTTRGRWNGDIWNRRKNGEVYLERITISMIRDAAGDPVRYVSVFSDITDLWRKDEYLKHLAFHDALTDLPNRSLLMELLRHQITVVRRERTDLALMFLDLDHFKPVNDTFGHDVGDDLLRIVAQRLLALVRQSDTVARLGGDEFVIKLDNPVHREEIVHIAERAIAAINEPMEFRGESVRVGTSIGIAVFPGDGQTPLELIKNADTAMYAAKNAGKNTYRFFESTMIAHVEGKPR